MDLISLTPAIVIKIFITPQHPMPSRCMYLISVRRDEISGASIIISSGVLRRNVYYYSAGVAGPTKEIYESACDGLQYLNKIADSFVMTMWMENAFLSKALGIVVLEVLFAQESDLRLIGGACF